MKTKENISLYRKYRLKVILPRAIEFFLYLFFFQFGFCALTWRILAELKIKFFDINPFDVSYIVLMIIIIVLWSNWGKWELKKALKEKIYKRTLKKEIRQLAEKKLSKTSKTIEKQKLITEFLK